MINLKTLIKVANIKLTSPDLNLLEHLLFFDPGGIIYDNYFQQSPNVAVAFDYIVDNLSKEIGFDLQKSITDMHNHPVPEDFDETIFLMNSGFGSFLYPSFLSTYKNGPAYNAVFNFAKKSPLSKFNYNNDSNLVVSNIIKCIPSNSIVQDSAPPLKMPHYLDDITNIIRQNLYKCSNPPPEQSGRVTRIIGNINDLLREIDRATELINNKETMESKTLSRQLISHLTDITTNISLIFNDIINNNVMDYDAAYYNENDFYPQHFDQNDIEDEQDIPIIDVPVETIDPDFVSVDSADKNIKIIQTSNDADSILRAIAYILLFLRKSFYHLTNEIKPICAYLENIDNPEKFYRRITGISNDNIHASSHDASEKAIMLTFLYNYISSI